MQAILEPRQKEKYVHLNICFYVFSNGYFFPIRPGGGAQAGDLLLPCGRAQSSCHPWGVTPGPCCDSPYLPGEVVPAQAPFLFPTWQEAGRGSWGRNVAEQDPGQPFPGLWLPVTTPHTPNHGWKGVGRGSRDLAIWVPWAKVEVEGSTAFAPWWEKQFLRVC